MKKIILTHEEVLDLLQSNVRKNGECLEWSGSIGSHGYGVITYHGKQHSTHRLALEKKLGRPLLDGHLACHTCDNRKCVNQDHLFEGTRYDNTHDMDVKGRRITTAKYNEYQILEIKAMRATGRSYQSIADQLDTVISVIWNACNKEQYKTKL